MSKLLERTSISIHALRGEGDIPPSLNKFAGREFQSTPSVGRATMAGVSEMVFMTFQSTPSVGRATHLARSHVLLELFQSTPSVGRATHGFCKLYNKQKISIHALRGEGDNTAENTLYNVRISIHALRGEGDSKQRYI